MKPIRKAVFPVAGLGTRFLPATKAMPKEMLTVVDRPLIQHVVDEAREAGIEHFIFVTGRNKGVIEDHFDLPFELERRLRSAARRPSFDCSRRRCPAAGATTSRASRRRSASATRCGARANSSDASRSRCCCPTCWCREAELPRADDRRLQASWAKPRTSSRSRKCRRTRFVLWRGRRRRAQGQVASHHLHGGEAEAGATRRPT